MDLIRELGEYLGDTVQAGRSPDFDVAGINEAQSWKRKSNEQIYTKAGNGDVHIFGPNKKRPAGAILFGENPIGPVNAQLRSDPKGDTIDEPHDHILYMEDRVISPDDALSINLNWDTTGVLTRASTRRSSTGDSANIHTEDVAADSRDLRYELDYAKPAGTTIFHRGPNKESANLRYGVGLRSLLGFGRVATLNGIPAFNANAQSIVQFFARRVADLIKPR